LSLFDIAGEQLEGSGSEETHRRNVKPKRTEARTTSARAAAASSLSRLFGTRRFRLQAAGGAALVLVVALAGLLPRHDLRIAVDGGTLSVSSRSASARVVANQAGVALGPGDRIERVDSDDLVVRRAIETTLFADGKTYTLRTQAESIDEALRDADVEYSDKDSIYLDGTLVEATAPITSPPALASRARSAAQLAAPSSAGVTIDVRRAVPFVVIENGQQLQLQSSRATVASALRAARVRVGPGDAVQPALSSEMTSGLEVHIDHAQPLVVTMPEGKVMLYTLADTVGEALTEGAVALPADYKLDPAPETVVGAGLAVHVIGVSAEQVDETERIESHTVYQVDADLSYGQQRVVEGHDGVLHRAYQVNYEDGLQTGRELASEWYDPEPADTVIYYSTATEPSQAPPVAATYNGDWRDLVCSYDWDCDWALAVIRCESGGNADAYNSSGYVGLFQIWQGHGDNLTDPATNIAAAYSLYLSGGAGNWPNCP
jgi:uncharacterized protein YabE (DUF348 family)